MAEESSNRPSSRTKNIVTGIILSGWVVSVLLIMSIVASSVYLQIANPTVPLPDTLREWAGIAMGFLFGNFFSIIKEYMTANKDI
jgi:tetrahydromethanopterin S-methyltransferase subunit F